MEYYEFSLSHMLCLFLGLLIILPAGARLESGVESRGARVTPMPFCGEVAPADSFPSVGGVPPIHFAPLGLVGGFLVLLLLLPGLLQPV